MRFTENGPAIPNDLLRARDEGRVVFFCGAGVSFARAGLVDFFGLAQSVIKVLGAPNDSDAAKVLNKAREIGSEIDVTGLISADRIFSLLERDFTKEDIQSAVAKNLKPKANVDRSAHQILLRLAKTESGKTQLVTTNFDRLFESEDFEVPVFQPPKLPQPRRFDDLNGLVYLHGRVDHEYSNADGNGFILSSSDFGHAYLSEGWANEFFRAILEKYVVVFVGYSADDPPVHYLLEGLSRHSQTPNKVYAFQSSESKELVARWGHKRVEAIPYSDADKHRALWDTLECWAERADDPVKWQHAVLTTSLEGPIGLSPHVRGQVAHIVSTYVGAKAFNAMNPPGEWLCVFDPRCRYGRPERIEWMNPGSAEIDPFTLFGIDFDRPPHREKEGPYSQSPRELENAWDAFELNDLDKKSLVESNLPKFRDHFQTQASALPQRIACLAGWIAKVVNQPATIWWAARQPSIHPQVSDAIDWQLTHLDSGISDSSRKIWHYILEDWSSCPRECARDWFDLKKDLERDGWSLAKVRQFVKISEPFLKVTPALSSSSIPPNMESTDSKIARIEVECTVSPLDAEIPKEWLPQVVRGLRSNVEHAADLFWEIDDWLFANICPIEKDESPDVSHFQRERDFSGCVIGFARLFEDLIAHDPKQAKREFECWRTDDDVAFARLRFWASAKPEIASVSKFTRVIRSLSDDVFWGSYHQRDLLIALRKRWNELTDKQRLAIEARLLSGPPKKDNEEEESYREYNAWAKLNRLHWLSEHGCDFSFDFKIESSKLERLCPTWRSESGKHAADSREVRGGFVATDTEHNALLTEPIESILSKALDLSGRVPGNHTVDKDPFLGLCSDRPKRAYLALSRAAKRGQHPTWAWKKFLSFEARENDTSEFSAIVAARLTRMGESALSELMYQTTWWIQKVSKKLSKSHPVLLDKVIDHFIDLVAINSKLGKSSVGGSNRRRDRVMEAINSPIGHLVHAIFDDSRFDTNGDFQKYLNKIAKCISLPEDARRHAITMAAHQLNWLFATAEEWTENHLLSVFEAEKKDSDRESFWAGYFWNPRITSPALYARLKIPLIEFATDIDAHQDKSKSLGALIVQGWIWKSKDDNERLIGDSELRDTLLGGGDEFRIQVLWQFKQGLRSSEESDQIDWRTSAYEFFEKIWPRQRVVKSSKMTGFLFEVLVADSGGFEALSEVVMPLLTKMHDAKGLHCHYHDETKELITRHPRKFANLLSTVLPGETERWPWGIGEVIDAIAQADKTILEDQNFRVLKQRWDAR